MRKILILALLGASAAPATAGSWIAPESCEVYMTVQSKGCRVSNHYRCLGDPQGDKWRADFDQEGLFFQSRVDYEGQWIESLDVGPNVRQQLDANPADPASFSELLSAGIDRFDFGLSRDDGTFSRGTGFDRLTGRTVVIDGVTLSETEFEFTETDPTGSVMRRSQGNEYVHPEWRLFFAGPSTWDGGDGTRVPMDGSPVDFIFPGEPGFQSTEPLYDCDTLTAGLPEHLWSVRHEP